MLNSSQRFAKDTAAVAAWDILREFNKVDYPIDPLALACKLGIVVWDRKLPITCNGVFMMHKDAGGFLINTRIRSEPRRNFTIAHELGHYILKHQMNHMILMDEPYVHELNNRKTKIPLVQEYQRCEQEANRFAVELLMPTPLFTADLSRETDVGFSVITALANKYRTSITSTARQYTSLCEHTCALVFSEGGRIKSFAYSEAFRMNWDCYVAVGRAIHENALASRLRRESYPVEYVGEVPLHYWSHPPKLLEGAVNMHFFDKNVIEHSRLVPGTDQIMTFLYLP